MFLQLEGRIMNRVSLFIGYVLLLLCVLLTCCSEDVPDVPEPLTEEEFWDIKGPEIEIIVPVDGSSVNWVTEVKGTYKRVPEGQNILVFISSHVIDPDLWYPRAVASINTNGTWIATCFVGRKISSPGTKFDIGVILVGKERIEDLLKEIESVDDIKPVALPDKILARITVTRN